MWHNYRSASHCFSPERNFHGALSVFRRKYCSDLPVLSFSSDTDDSVFTFLPRYKHPTENFQLKFPWAMQQGLLFRNFILSGWEALNSLGPPSPERRQNILVFIQWQRRERLTHSWALCGSFSHINSLHTKTQFTTKLIKKAFQSVHASCKGH